MNLRPPIHRAIIAAALFAVLSGSAHAQSTALPAEVRVALAGHVRHSLEADLLDRWYPAVLDFEEGGYLSDLDHRWQPSGAQDKMLVTQARHLWTLSRAALFLPHRSEFLSWAEHGYRFLRDVMWDDALGGFYMMATRDGLPIPEDDGRFVKQAYGIAFAIYGLAAYYDASGDPEALELAKRSFRWLDHHAYDAQHGGYFQFIDRDGTAMRDGHKATPPKDQNSSIHILEAFSELYQVWPDEHLGVRLREMLELIRDTLTVEPGFLTLFSTADWQPISYRDSSDVVREANIYFDHVSYGHDVETAYLMLEASDVAGMSDRGVTLSVAKKMVDHALQFGWDEDVGGFVDAGYYFEGENTPQVIRATKNWWAQAEGLNTLLLMADEFPDDPIRYDLRFLDLWAYIRGYLVDPIHGGWFEGGIDKQPEFAVGPKSHIWKGAYHDVRAMMNVIRRLEAAAN